MSAITIRERMTDYAVMLNEVVTVLETPRRQVTPADRRAITKLLYAMTDVNAMMVYHLNRQRLPAGNLAELRAKVACLASRGM